MSENASKTGASASVIFKGKPLLWTAYNLGLLLARLGDWGGETGERMMRAAVDMARR